jgi:putative acetyltransferase
MHHYNSSEPPYLATCMQIRVDDLSGQAIRTLIAEHLREMRGLSPACSVHALDLDGLTRSDVTFWTAWRDGELLGCGALKQLTVAHGEIKSMRTASTHRREGVASSLLRHIVLEGRTRSYERLSLETGAGPAFAPARSLYQSFGFGVCEPFGEYRHDPNSVYLSIAL